MKRSLFPILISLFALYLVSCDSDKAGTEVVPTHEPTFHYGIRSDTFKVIEDTVERNEFLGSILQRFNVDGQKINTIAVEYDSVFPANKIRYGKKYTVLATEDTDTTVQAHYLIYEPNKIDYVVYDLRSDVNVSIHQKDVVKKRMTATGVINSSLFKTMDDQGLDIELALEMSNIYAWSVNFFKLQKGDAFKIIYTENFVEGEPVGIDSIHAALFTHRKKDFYAFYYGHQDSMFSPGFYDDSARMNKKAFLTAPLKYTRISSKYSKRRFHPIYKRYKAHLGTDFAAPYGTPIYTTADGTVIKVGRTRGNGNYVKVMHNDVYTTQYLHMQSFAKDLKEGMFVQQGEVIGYVGSTGAATGPHVCYRFWKHGKQVDPFSLDLPKAKSLEGDVKIAYLEFIRPLKEKLDALQYEDTRTIAKTDLPSE